MGRPTKLDAAKGGDGLTEDWRKQADEALAAATGYYTPERLSCTNSSHQRDVKWMLDSLRRALRELREAEAEEDKSQNSLCDAQEQVCRQRREIEHWKAELAALKVVCAAKDAELSQVRRVWQEMGVERNELAARIVELAKDKERLDWLESMPIMETMRQTMKQSDGNYPTWTVKKSWEPEHTGKTLRAAIDAAMKGKASE